MEASQGTETGTLGDTFNLVDLLLLFAMVLRGQLNYSIILLPWHPICMAK